MSLRERTRPGLGIIEPCLPSPAKAPPSGPGWIHEIKHDGFRIMARRDSAGVRLISRHGNVFTARFPLVVAVVTAVPAHSFLIDGEAIATNDDGLAVSDLCPPDASWRQGGALRFRSDRARRRGFAPVTDRAAQAEAGEASARSASGHRAQRARGRRRHNIPARLQARLRGHRFKAAWLALSLRPVAALGQRQKPESAGRETRGRGRLGQAQSQVAAEMTLPPQRPLRESLFWSTVVIAVGELAAVILWAATSWLWLIVHAGL